MGRRAEAELSLLVKRGAAIALAIALLAPAPAVAKGLRAVEICGASECRSLPAREVRDSDIFDWLLLGNRVGANDRPPAAANRWRAVITHRWGVDGRKSKVLRQTVYPRERYIRSDGEWSRMPHHAALDWRDVVRGIDPLGADVLNAGGEQGGGSLPSLSLLALGALAVGGAGWAGARRLRHRP